MNLNAHEPGPFPLDYRQAEIERIARCLRAGDSCSIVGVSGMAKSNLFRHLLNTTVRYQYLVDNWWSYLFLAVDSHALSEVSERAMYNLLLELLAKEAQGSALPGEVIEHIRQLHQQSLASSDVLLWQRAFTQAVEAVMAADSTYKLVFLFDQFDELYQGLSPRFFIFLRSLRDQYKYRLCFLLFTRDELSQLGTFPEAEEFYEVLSPNVMELSPYNHSDAMLLLARVSGRYEESLAAESSERLIGLSGGHPGLLKATCMALINEKLNLPQDDPEASQTLLLVDDVRTECTKLWSSLDQEEQEALHGLATTGTAASYHPDLLRRLRLKQLIKNQSDRYQLLCPIFATFAAAQKTGSEPQIRVQAGPIRIDSAGEVWVGGKQLTPSLTKKELLLLEYFCLEPGRLRTKDEIIAVVYPEEYQAGGTVTDDALAALIKRLRDRLQQDATGKSYIATLRGKGYRLEV